jgi:ribonucleoside-diphosphate reductase alpha chain
MPKSEEKKGLQVNRHYTKDGVSPFDLFEYDIRSSVIRNPSGDAVFEMNNVEVPKSWSQVATDILAQKYFRKAGVPQADGTMGGETSIKQVAHRMADCWRMWGEKVRLFCISQTMRKYFMTKSCIRLCRKWQHQTLRNGFNTGLHSSYGITGKPQGHYFVDPTTGKLSKSTSAYERPQPHACFILSVSDDLVNDGRYHGFVGA